MIEKTSDSARLDTELLLAHCLEKNRTYLFAWPEKTLTARQIKEFQTCMDRRLSGEPVAYILGVREFWSLSLKVNDSTLIPRPDTETLVELSLAKLSSKNERILDLGTGTGAIALAIAKECPHASVIACDKSNGAVILAEQNRKDNGLANVKVMQSDWFDNVEGRFSVIISNPPYIDEGDEHLSQGDVQFEPKSALIAGDNGLADLAHIISCSPHYLASNGWLLLEHGWKQGAEVRRLMEVEGFTHVQTIPDLNGQDRVTEGQFL